jgi:hypothetical protein
VFATGVLVPAFAREYREEGTLPGQAGPDTTLVWPPLKLAALFVLAVLFLRFWDGLQRDERAAR